MLYRDGRSAVFTICIATDLIYFASDQDVETMAVSVAALQSRCVARYDLTQHCATRWGARPRPLREPAFRKCVVDVGNGPLWLAQLFIRGFLRVFLLFRTYGAISHEVCKIES